MRAKLVDAALKDDFDRWYQKEHLPDALKGFNARRGWSAGDPLVRDACDESDSKERAQAVEGSNALKS